MKKIEEKLISVFKEGYCTPQIAKLVKKLKEAGSTIHYNIKKLETEGKIKTYKAVFDYEKINENFCAYLLINLNPDEYGNPERISEEFSKYKEIESIDIISGDWEILMKVRTKNKEEYYEFVKNTISRKGIQKIKTLISLKQIKTEFVKL